MSTPALATVRDLPGPVSRVLTEVVDALQQTFGDSLEAVVLFGSAAENRLRPTSDVNIVIVLTRLDRAKLDAVRDVLQVAHAAVRLNAMWLLAHEIRPAAAAFAVKFADIARRRRVLIGRDPFEGLQVPRAAAVARVRQVTLNLMLRLRASYALDGDREERLALIVADTIGPLRAAAAEILDLDGRPAASPREALEQIVRERPDIASSGVIDAARAARETRRLPAGTAAGVFDRIVDVADDLHRRAEALA
jgi:hypothetical protein